MTTTADLGVPLLSSQQQTPEIIHNEAIELLCMLQNGVIRAGDNTPPGSPTSGDSYIVGTSPTGDWAGRAKAIARYTSSGWRFFPDRDSAGSIITPGARHEGIRVYNRDDNTPWVFNGSTWQAEASGGLPTSGGVGSVLSLAAEPVEVFEDSSNMLAFDYDDSQWLEWTATQSSTVLTVVTANLPIGAMLRIVIYDADTYAPDISAFTPLLDTSTSITFNAVTIIFVEKIGDGTVRYIDGGRYAS